EAHLAAPDAGQIPLALLIGPERHDRRRDRRHRERAVGHAGVVQLLNEDELEEGALALAAVHLRPAHTQIAAPVQLLAEGLAVRTAATTAGLVVLLFQLRHHLGRAELVDEGPHFPAEVDILLIPTKVHRSTSLATHRRVTSDGAASSTAEQRRPAQGRTCAPRS